MNLILQYGISAAIIIRVISFIVLLSQIIPLQIKEAGVRNGLRKLRLMLLVLGVSLFIGNFIALWLLFTTKVALDGNVIARFNQILTAIMLLIPSIALYLIYHSQYTPEAKIVHKRVEKEEKKAEKIEQKKKAKFDKQQKKA